MEKEGVWRERKGKGKKVSGSKKRKRGVSFIKNKGRKRAYLWGLQEEKIRKTVFTIDSWKYKSIKKKR